MEHLWKEKSVWAYWVCVTIAILTTAIALFLDLSAWFDDSQSASECWRFARTVLCGLALVGVIKTHGNTTDKWLMLLALSLAVIADYFLILKNNLVTGIGIFAIMQIVLIARHSIGVSFKKFYQPQIGFAVAIGLLVLLIGNGLLWSSLSEKGLTIPVLIYSSLLITSVVTAYSTRFTGLLSTKQANYAFMGMILFLLCDITVGIGAAFGHTSEGQLVRSLTGLFYTPSLLLLAKSA